jgi:hypothetical protein
MIPDNNLLHVREEVGKVERDKQLSIIADDLPAFVPRVTILQAYHQVQSSRWPG